MTAQALIAALGLPPDSLITQRISKKLLLEQVVARTRFTAAQRRALQDGIDELHWIAALKPSTAGIPAFRDRTRQYLEIAVLTCRLRAGTGKAKASVPRIAELLHRAIPYPTFLVMEQELPNQRLSLSVALAHKRFSAGEQGETVMEELQLSAPLDDGPLSAAFAASLSLASCSPAGAASDAFTLYTAWCDRLTALEAANICDSRGGSYTLTPDPVHAAALRERLALHRQLTRELTSARAQAARETQINRRVDLNLSAKALEARLHSIIDALTSSS